MFYNIFKRLESLMFLRPRNWMIIFKHVEPFDLCRLATPNVYNNNQRTVITY